MFESALIAGTISSDIYNNLGAPSKSIAATTVWHIVLTRLDAWYAGYVYEQLGRVADARAAYRRAISADPANPQVELFRMYDVSCGHSHPVQLQPYINLALECKSRGHLDEAIVWLEQGAEAADTSANLMFNLGVMYQTQGMSQHVCRRVGRWRPHYWWLATGAILAANKAYNRALALDPKYPEPRMNVAALHHRYGDVEQAVEQYQILLALPELGTGMEANLRKNLAQAYLDLGDVAASLDGTNSVQESLQRAIFVHSGPCCWRRIWQVVTR